MDPISAALLERAKKLRKPHSNDSAWSFSYERTIGALVGLLAGRDAFLFRASEHGLDYHDDVRSHLPDLLRDAIRDGDPLLFDWNDSDAFRFWNGGYFVNGGQFRIATGLEKLLRVATFKPKFEPMLRGKHEPNRERCTRHVVCAARQLLEKRKNTKAEALVLEAFSRPYENNTRETLDRLFPEENKELIERMTPEEVFEIMRAGEEHRGYSLRQVSESVNAQKHVPGDVRKFSRSVIEWGVTVAALYSLLELHDALVELDLHRSKEDPRLTIEKDHGF